MSVTASRLHSDPASLEEALAEADPVILLMVYVNLTGDVDYLEQFRPFIRKVREFNNSIPVELEADLRRRLAALLASSDQATQRMPDADVLQKMMSVCVGEPIPEDYLPMLLDELDMGEAEHLTVARAATQAAEVPSIAIIGAGLSGVCMAIMLKQAGIPFRLYERHNGVGGTWYENTYPGCGVDTANHWYSYSFAINPDWTKYFVKQVELRSYIDQCVRKFGIADDIEFNTSVESAVFNESKGVWDLVITAGDGERRAVSTDILISAVGLLNKPIIPDLPGLPDFRGPAFHTACWDHGVDLAGKRVALVGSGASGIQVGPEIAPKVAHLSIFQRSPQWIYTRANYGRDVPEGVKWALRHVPLYAKWYRFQLLWAYSDGLYPALVRDMEWTRKDSISAFNHDIRKLWTAYIEKQLADRPDLLEKAIPDFPTFGKRPLFDTGWFDMLKRENVSLTQSGIAQIVPDGIVTEDGEKHEVDVIVFATGFHASFMLHSLNVTGRAGRTIRDEWGEEDPKAYLGIAVPGFPNLFLLNGPNTAYAHGGSIAFNAECQARYVLQCLTEMMQRGAGTMEVRQDAYENYNAHMDEEHEKLVWAHHNVRTWYKNKLGRVTAVTPLKVKDYWNITRKVSPEHYTFS